jgi:hypothetical protein
MTTIMLLLALAQAAVAVPPPSAPGAFDRPWTTLVGDWVGEGGGEPGAGVGTASFTLDLERHVLLRHARSDYPAAAGRPAVHHEDLMVIYPDSSSGHGAARALYVDNEGHSIAYRASWSAGGSLLTFVSDPQPGTPTFRLTYRVLAANRIDVTFEIAPPGGGAFRPYVAGVMRRTAAGGVQE